MCHQEPRPARQFGRLKFLPTAKGNELALKSTALRGILNSLSATHVKRSRDLVLSMTTCVEGSLPVVSTCSWGDARLVSSQL